MTNKNKNGFTLVEVLAVVVILGVLLVIAMPSYTAVFNSLKRTAYLNKVKSLNLAAKDYLSNTSVKDEVKDATNDKPNWCKTIRVSDLIKAGYLLSESETENIIYDNYTGNKIGYNSLSNDDSYVSLCYCKNKLSFESYLVKDLAKNMDFREDEIVRDIKSEHYVYYTITKSFTYNEVAGDVIRALNSGKSEANSNGVKITISNEFDEVSNYSTDDTAFINALNTLIFKYFAKATSCNF